MTSYTVQLPDETLSRLDHLAKKLDRPAAALAAQAIQEFIGLEEWRIREIEAGLAEAEAGEFATPEEFGRVIGKFALRKS